MAEAADFPNEIMGLSLGEAEAVPLAPVIAPERPNARWG